MSSNSETTKNVIAVYTGGGFGGSFTGIPARDLTAEEVEQAGGLEAVLATGLYEAVEAEEAGGEDPESEDSD